MPRRKPAEEDLDDLMLEAAGELDPVIPQDTTPQQASYTDRLRLRKLISELAGRQAEALKIYEPLPVIDRFHGDRSGERLLRGSNRAGKTLGAAVEMARVVTGQDPYGKCPARDGRAFLVGLDGQHLGEVMYRKLFRAGAFKMIRDRVTGQWRAFRPQAEDKGFEHLAKPAPPLIPGRFVREVAWEDKKRGVPKKVTLTTGWELNFYSSKGAPPQGSDIDLWWIDEEVENEAWYPELAARVLDRKGRGYWSATPQIASQQLYDMHVRHEKGEPDIGEHVALLEDNPHIAQEEKDKLFSRLTSEEERRVRIRGEFALTGFKIYPNFSKDVHGLEWAGPIPRDWSLTVVTDPGRQVCAVLFGAVPPRSAGLGDCLVLWDELYIKNCDAQKYGQAVAAKLTGMQQPEVFLIDSHAGRVTEMGSGKNVEAQYRQALRDNKVVSARSGSGFVWGADDPKAGILKVHEYLRIRECGTPRLLVLKGRLPNFEWEAERYHYRRIAKLVSDEPEKKNDHLMDCLRYLCMYGPTWSKPKPKKKALGYAVRALKAKLERRKKRDRDKGYVNLGPGR